ncbi:Uncharacterized membrane protein, YraQ family [hydrothermal vent metagenome]|uniref:Uncharacterized membrane protein, YraQ family n=1 Tax=hydrothermal vent metagenome TaxID=652676 RepID=A0A3B0ZHN6_9ZZZZ
MDLPGTTFFAAAWAILSESSFWVVISLISGGLLHEFLSGSRIKPLLNRSGLRAYTGAIAFGALLPICSCGVIPLAVSLYRSGVRLGPVMAFAAATPIINPAAVILSFALLGPQLSFAYIALGLCLPLILGFLVERFGDPVIIDDSMDGDAPNTCCASTAPAKPSSIMQRSLAGIRWGILELGPSICFYLAIGVLLGAVLNTFVPEAWIQQYLNSPTVWSLLAAALLGASIYVCAVAHIPLVASLIASGAGPGVAIVFLVTGTATNLPELFTLYKTIGRRTIVLYASTLVLASLVAGWLVNWWLMPGFTIEFDPLKSLEMTELSEHFWLSPAWTINVLSTYGVSLLAIIGLVRRLRGLFRRQAQPGCCGSD